jgi:hypothetical protein
VTSRGERAGGTAGGGEDGVTSYRFKPRFRGVAWTSIGVGGALGGVSIAAGFLLVPVITGAVGIAAGVAYLASPTWRIAVTVDDDALSVGSPAKQRFRLPWSDVKRVIAAPEKHTCFVDGGAPERSLLVPGEGAPAPYDIENKQALVDEILARVASDKIERVASLADAAKSEPLRT